MSSQQIISRDDAIELAVAYLGANDYASYTRYSFTDKGNDEQVLLVTDDDMEAMGRKLVGLDTDYDDDATQALGAYAEWTQGRGEYTTAAEVAASFGPGEVTSVDGLQESAGAAGDYLTAAVCYHDELGLKQALGLS